MTVSYIGVTGFVDSDEVHGVLGSAPFSADRRLMVGALASGKTLLGDKTRYPRRYPTIENVGKPFLADPRVLNLVHYAAGQRYSTLAEDMMAVLEKAGPDCHGFQLNVVWPEPEQIFAVKNRVPNLHVVLQIGATAVSRVGFSPLLAARYAADYEGIVDAVLFDMSGGKGLDLPLQDAWSFLASMGEYGPTIDLGVAGGLCANNMGRLSGLFAKWPKLSIDAEGKLRYQDDRLNLEAAKDYAVAAFDIIG